MAKRVKLNATDEDGCVCMRVGIKEEAPKKKKKRSGEKKLVSRLEVSRIFFLPLSCLYATTKTYYHNHRFPAIVKSIQSPASVLTALWVKHQYLCAQG